MIRLGLLLALLAAPALAAPEYFRVHGVRTGDTLNVRAAPSGRAEDIGDLAHDAAPVEVLEQRGGWARIAHGEQDGWISARYLKPVTPPGMIAAPGIPVGLFCSGTEPFWSLEFSGPNETEYRNTDAYVDYAIPHAAVAEGMQSFPVALSLIGIGTSAVAVMRHAECSDGMRDVTLGWSIDLLTQARGEAILLSGCCQLPLPR